MGSSCQRGPSESPSDDVGLVGPEISTHRLGVRLAGVRGRPLICLLGETRSLIHQTRVLCGATWRPRGTSTSSGPHRLIRQPQLRS
jgi:hypothetical protein